MQRCAGSARGGRGGVRQSWELAISAYLGYDAPSRDGCARSRCAATLARWRCDWRGVGAGGRRNGRFGGEMAEIGSGTNWPTAIGARRAEAVMSKTGLYHADTAGEKHVAKKWKIDI